MNRPDDVQTGNNDMEKMMQSMIHSFIQRIH